MEKSQEPRWIMLPVDNSIHSERAFDWYVKNLHKPGDKLGIVHIHDPPSPSEAFGVWDRMVVESENRWREEFQKSIAESKEVIKKFENKAKDCGVDSETFLTNSNYGPGHAICDIADRKDAVGIVMGSRGLNFFRRTLLGSVSSYVINHANTTVTVTPPSK
ncbi:universal stress protein YxiE-like [Hydractinia symbiolongicarpus]|uniref:universal stress protein YxiE-like n=1 Tax=Hydractinia symbiolongicarpus TaxID=13093 RepID=UPI00254F45DB|nr:universal stress protein YxiE-like [Hydractinia symbiolongicarpus]